MSKIDKNTNIEINTIKIENYRPISDLVLDELKPINVFVGRNNTGKSSILEAIALAYSAQYGWFDVLGDNILEEIINKRGGLESADTIIKMNSSFSDIYIKGKNIEGSLRIERDLEKLSTESFESLNIEVFEYFNNLIEQYAYDEQQLTFFSRDEVPRLRERTVNEQKKETLERMRGDIVKYIPLFFEFKNSNTTKYEYLAILGRDFYDKLLEIIGRRTIRLRSFLRSTDKGRGNIVFLLSTSLQYLQELQKRLVIDGRLLNLLRTLRKEIDYFEDIRQADNTFYISQRNMVRPLPLQSMGDGFNANLSLFSAMSLMDDGVIIMEEPETRLHPGFMDSVSKQIVYTAERFNIQYFISTHSLEFTEYLLEDNCELLNVIRLNKDDVSGEIDYQIFTGKEAKKQVDVLEQDLRGI